MKSHKEEKGEKKNITNQPIENIFSLVTSSFL